MISKRPDPQRPEAVRTAVYRQSATLLPNKGSVALDRRWLIQVMACLLTGIVLLSWSDLIVVEAGGVIAGLQIAAAALSGGLGIVLLLIALANILRFVRRRAELSYDGRTLTVDALPTPGATVVVVGE